MMCKQCTKYKPSYNVNEIHPLKMELLNYLYMLIYIYRVSIIVCYLMTEPMKQTSKSFGHRILHIQHSFLCPKNNNATWMPSSFGLMGEKGTQNSQYGTDHIQNLMNCCQHQREATTHILWKSIHNLLKSYADRQNNDFQYNPPVMHK